jgi:hypothetical protein
MRNEAKADVFDYIERFYNAKRRHTTIGYMGASWSTKRRLDYLKWASTELAAGQADDAQNNTNA